MNILHHRTATSCQNRRGKDESPGCSACPSSEVVNRIARGGCIFSKFTLWSAGLDDNELANATVFAITIT